MEIGTRIVFLNASILFKKCKLKMINEVIATMQYDQVCLLASASGAKISNVMRRISSKLGRDILRLNIFIKIASVASLPRNDNDNYELRTSSVSLSCACFFSP